MTIVNFYLFVKYFHILPIFFYYYLLPVINILYRIIRNEDR